jgi:hypothetical protein
MGGSHDTRYRSRSCDYFGGHSVRDLGPRHVESAADTADELATECDRPWAFGVGGMPPLRLGGRAPRAR